MHRDDVAAVAQIEEISGNITKISPSKEREFLPLGGNLSADDLKKWWARRAVPLYQGNIEKIFEDRGISTPQTFLVQNLGLSLSDHYWMKPVNSPFQWSDVNLFENDFRDEIGDLQIRENYSDRRAIDLRGKTAFYPSSSLQGELKKKWMIADGKRYLIKGNYGATCQQSLNEVIATLVHQKQSRMPYTGYQLCEIDISDSAGIGCICENFSTSQLEFVPAYDVVSSVKKSNDVSEYEHFIAVCGMHGMNTDEVRAFLEYQILTDFAITNTDRHFNNFGVLRDSNTLKFVSMAPIFDSGNSMFWNCPGLLKSDHLLNVKVNSFRKKETDLLAGVTDFRLLDISKLPSEQEIGSLLEKDAFVRDNIAGILQGYRRKAELLEKVQRGEKIWKYGYEG